MEYFKVSVCDGVWREQFDSVLPSVLILVVPVPVYMQTVLTHVLPPNPCHPFPIQNLTLTNFSLPSPPLLF